MVSFFFLNQFFNWKLVALQTFVIFCHTTWSTVIYFGSFTHPLPRLLNTMSRSVPSLVLLRLVEARTEGAVPEGRRWNEEGSGILAEPFSVFKIIFEIHESHRAELLTVCGFCPQSRGLYYMIVLPFFAVLKILWRKTFCI